MKSSKKQTAMRAAWNTIVVNVLLSLYKLVAGILGNSAAMLSDAAHSFSDVVSTGVVMVGIKMAEKEADADHPYGHERLESVAAIILAVMLCLTGVGIGFAGFKNVVSEDHDQLAVPGMIALVAAFVSIVVKEAMYWYTRAVAKKISSGALMADAWHHRSDALSSIGSLVGIAGARMGYPVLDSVAALVICVFIVKASWDIFFDAVSKMTDRALDEESIARIRTLVLDHEKVKTIDKLRTRIFGDKVCVDLEIGVDGEMLMREAHDVAHAVHEKIVKAFPQVKHCMVHVNPREKKR